MPSLLDGGFREILPISLSDGPPARSRPAPRRAACLLLYRNRLQGFYGDRPADGAHHQEYCSRAAVGTVFSRAHPARPRLTGPTVYLPCPLARVIETNAQERPSHRAMPPRVRGLPCLGCCCALRPRPRGHHAPRRRRPRIACANYTASYSACDVPRFRRPSSSAGLRELFPHLPSLLPLAAPSRLAVRSDSSSRPRARWHCRFVVRVADEEWDRATPSWARLRSCSRPAAGSTRASSPCDHPLAKGRVPRTGIAGSLSSSPTIVHI